MLAFEPPREGAAMSKQIGSSDASPKGRLNGLPAYFAGTAIILSLFSITIVLGNLLAGAPPQADENSWAHLFQLAMAAQVPLFLLFLMTADWTRPRPAMVFLMGQICAAAGALAALWWSGY